MLELISINFMFVAINSLVANGSKFWFSDGAPTLSNEFFTRISDYVNQGWNSTTMLSIRKSVSTLIAKNSDIKEKHLYEWNVPMFEV